MTSQTQLVSSALIIIDVQKAIDDPSWGERNNMEAEQNIAKLLSKWRKSRWPIYHIRHNSLEPHSTYRPDQKGNAFKPEARPLEGETIINKSTNSAFVGTNFQEILRSKNHLQLVIAGVITNNSVETTVRHGGNLGFQVFLVEDACFTFGKKDWNGTHRSAEDVHAMTLSNLHEEYCAVITTDDALTMFTEINVSE